MDDRIETGSCFCGAVAAEMRGDPFWICYDHDDDCRQAIGSPVNIWVGYRTNQFRLTRGEPKSFSKTRGVVRTFCPECGTSIGYLDEGLGDELYLTIGFLDNAGSSAIDRGTLFWHSGGRPSGDSRLELRASQPQLSSSAPDGQPP